MSTAVAVAFGDVAFTASDTRVSWADGRLEDGHAKFRSFRNGFASATGCSFVAAMGALDLVQRIDRPVSATGLDQYLRARFPAIVARARRESPIEVPEVTDIIAGLVYHGAPAVVRVGGDGEGGVYSGDAETIQAVITFPPVHAWESPALRRDRAALFRPPTAEQDAEKIRLVGAIKAAASQGGDAALFGPIRAIAHFFARAAELSDTVSPTFHLGWVTTVGHEVFRGYIFAEARALATAGDADIASAAQVSIAGRAAS